MRRLIPLLLCLGLVAPLDGQSKGPATAAADPYVGSFTGDGGSITVQKEGSTYSGTITANGVGYPYTARKMGRALVGTFQADGQGFLFSASVSGDQMTFIANGETTILQRGRPRAGPGRAASGANAPAPASTPRAASGQDAEIQRILLSSPWCYMRYSQTLGSTNTERGVFYPDGRLVVTTGHEMVSSGQNGTAYGSSSGGSTYRWRVSGGDLHLSENGVPFAPAGLRITQNSNGYPILNVDGKEYSQCR